MSKPKYLECDACEGVFRIMHDMSENHYIEKHCVFCGTKLEIEVGLELEEDEDENYDLEW